MKKIIYSLSFLFGATLIVLYLYARSLWFPYYIALVGKQTNQEVLEKHHSKVAEELKPLFEAKGLSYPPQNLTMLALKEEKLLELWSEHNAKWFLIKTYPILKTSGELGPKLQEGDKQVPEGIYKIEGFNPYSSYHLSMKLNYPNSFDLYYAQNESRTTPGSNIFIHGKEVSVGCLAMGDTAIEELFVLSYLVSRANIEVIISPKDPRKHQLIANRESPAWTNVLYKNISKASKDLIQ